MYNLTTGAARVLGRRLLPRQSLPVVIAVTASPHGGLSVKSFSGSSAGSSNKNNSIPSDSSQPVHDPPVLTLSSSNASTKNNGTSNNPPSEEWIPPNRPLSGDQGFLNPTIINQPEDKDSSITTTFSAAIDEALFIIDDNDTDEDIQRKLDAALQLEEELERQEFQKALTREQEWEEQQTRPVAAPDWLATRRAALGKRAEDAARMVPIRPHQLLTEQELVALLEYQDGINVKMIRDNPKVPRMGGADGMIVCEATTLFHVQAITRALIDHLKERQLQEIGVLGAQMGSNRHLHSSNWNVVDCHNYMVHILDGPTRQALQLEKLWSGKDPLWKLDIANDDAVDRYVEQHPVPPTYGPSYPQQQTTWDIGRLERNKFAPHTPIVSSLQKQEDRKAGRRRLRTLRHGFA